MQFIIATYTLWRPDNTSAKTSSKTTKMKISLKNILSNENTLILEKQVILLGTQEILFSLCKTIANVFLFRWTIIVMKTKWILNEIKIDFLPVLLYEWKSISFEWKKNFFIKIFLNYIFLNGWNHSIGFCEKSCKVLTIVCQVLKAMLMTLLKCVSHVWFICMQ